MNKNMQDAQARWILEQEVYKLRCLQIGSGMPDSEFFKLIAKTFNLTGGMKEAELILSIVHKLKTRERINHDSESQS